jgi:diguanylate cyclase (GGDEF)-like protein
MIEKAPGSEDMPANNVKSNRGARFGLHAIQACSFGLLGLRAYLGNSIGEPWTIVAILRIALPGSAFAVLMLLAIQSLMKSKRPWVVAFASKPGFMAILVFVVSLMMSSLDVLAGLPPYMMIAGMAVYGSLAWSHPPALVVSALAGVAGIGGLAAFDTGSISLEVACVLALAFALALYSADIVRKNVAPTEARLRSLEAENKELWNLSYRDGLTGLFNRRYMEQVSTYLFARAARYREPLHVLMLDIDHFKKVNDKLGHQVGDEVLQTIAATIQSIIRTTDTVARYGGEEFIAFLVQSNPEITQYIANRIRDGVASTQFDGVPWQITISIGVSGLQDGDTVQTLIDRADQFLYSSKRHGRNRVSGF